MICPPRGGRISSLFDPHAGREWLVPAPLRPLRAVTHGSLWSAYEMCGWDDAFPTIGDCAHPGPGRATGVRLPDHGEVWSMAWEDETEAVDPGGEAVVLSAVGAALPYRLTRRFMIDGPTVRLDYSLANEGADALPFQWAAYPLVLLRPDSEVVTPVPVAAGPGLRFPAGDEAVEWAAVVDRETGNWLHFSWDAAEVPWFGAVVDDEGLNPRTNVVLLPTTGGGPDLEAAAVASRVRILEPAATARWTLRATVGSGPLPTA
jgi:hypothetical protein